jgi:F0F1-type ATP synthase delta subunit
VKYSPQIYAKAFSAIATKSSVKDNILLRNFLALIKKNNDQHLLKKICARVEKLIREKTGRRKIVIEIARPVKNLDDATGKITRKDDLVEEKINPDLIAGIRIVVDDERQFDGSMAAKIKRLFSW